LPGVSYETKLSNVSAKCWQNLWWKQIQVLCYFFFWVCFVMYFCRALSSYDASTLPRANCLLVSELNIYFKIISLNWGSEWIICANSKDVLHTTRIVVIVVGFRYRVSVGNVNKKYISKNRIDFIISNYLYV